MDHIITLNQFIIQDQKALSFATGQLSGLLRDISLASKQINTIINRNGLEKITAQIANKQFISCLKSGGNCCGFASLKNETYLPIEKSASAKYVVLFDPLNGDNAIDVNGSLGSTFAIYRRISDDGVCQMKDFLQDGVEQVAAGYVVYGSSTILVYSARNGVNGFTLDPSIGAFCLSHPNIQIPQKGTAYVVDQGNYHQFDPSIQQFINACMDKNYAFRYVGSIVADVHRTLIKGGLFMSPTRKASPNENAPLLQVCNPLSFILEQAKGASSNGKQRILELGATTLHQQTAIFMGSPEMLDDLEKCLLHKHNSKLRTTITNPSQQLLR